MRGNQLQGPIDMMVVEDRLLKLMILREACTGKRARAGWLHGTPISGSFSFMGAPFLGTEGGRYCRGRRTFRLADEPYQQEVNMGKLDKTASVAIDVAGGSAKRARTRPGAEIDISAEAARKVDLVYVIDTTGSMNDKIEGLLETCTRFVEEFAALDLDHRAAVVAFGDLKVPGDKIMRTGFTSRVKVTKKSLRNIPRYSGGGNQGESSLEALDKTLAMPFRSHAVRVVILITDEPAHQYEIRGSEMAVQLAQEEVLTFVISPPLSYFKEMATKTGGKWYQVSATTDFTDMLELFREVAEKVSHVVSDVYELGDGSVADYLRLKRPGR